VSCDRTFRGKEGFLETKVGARQPLGAIGGSSLNEKARPGETCRAIASAKDATYVKVSRQILAAIVDKSRWVGSERVMSGTVAGSG
jgi:hypothetical protein